MNTVSSLIVLLELIILGHLTYFTFNPFFLILFHFLDHCAKPVLKAYASAQQGYSEL